ncbi:beta-1,3-galactosyltransferase 5 [Thrips palmi]|uniref:Hexosyltransferase n=1 Tax=Thrips palmi TaxID=161013 RepID=A0A6P8YEP4_THRPL|nr:beta-1,3-galactosyltransferase 5 [Thrips palmi]
MGRVLAGVLMVCLSLPCYVWYAGQTPSFAPPGPGPHAAPLVAQPTVPPYQLLNESQPAPLEELLGLADDDAVSLIDVRGFRWLLAPAAPGVCAPLVLVLVHTATDHTEHRRLIRETWGSWGSQGQAHAGEVLVRFLVGQTAASDAGVEEQRRLEEEAAVHGDVVQGSFTDAYRNMTYKHAMGLKWFATKCPNAKYVLKVDDDAFVNTPVLLDFVRHALSPHGARRLLACTVVTGARVRRSWRSKWRVAYGEFPGHQYPDYCEGWAVLYSPDVALALYRELQRGPYFWIDDVYVTGVLAARLGLAHAAWDPLVLTAGDLPRMLSGEQRPAFMLALWYSTNMDMATERQLWARVVSDTERARALNTTWTPSRRL